MDPISVEALQEMFPDDCIIKTAGEYIVVKRETLDRFLGGTYFRIPEELYFNNVSSKDRIATINIFWDEGVRMPQVGEAVSFPKILIGGERGKDEKNVRSPILSLDNLVYGVVMRVFEASSPSQLSKGLIDLYLSNGSEGTFEQRMVKQYPSVEGLEGNLDKYRFYGQEVEVREVKTANISDIEPSLIIGRFQIN